MMGLKQKFGTLPKAVKSATAFVIASVLTQGLHIITTPIYTRLLSTADMGIVTAYGSYESIVGTIVGMGFVSGAFSIAMNEYPDKRDQYSSSILTLSMLVSSIAFILMLLFREPLSQIMHINTSLIILMGLGLIVTPARSMWNAKNRFEYKYKITILVSIASLFVSVCFSLIAIVWYKHNTEVNLGQVRLIATSIISYSVSLVIAGSIFCKGKCFKDTVYWRFAVAAGIPMVIHSIAKVIFDSSDRIMILHLCGASDVGIYGTLYSISSVAVILWTAINGSLVPYLFECINKGKTTSIQKVTNVLLGVYAAGCGFFILMAPEIVALLTTNEYMGGIHMIPPIAAGIFFTALYNMYSTMLLYRKKTTLIMLSTVISAIVNIVLNYLLIPIYGYVTASYTTLVSYIVLALTQYLFMRYEVKNDYYDERVFFGLSLGVIAFSIFANAIYEYIVIRYLCILVMLIIGVMNHKKIVDIMLKVRKKEAN